MAVIHRRISQERAGVFLSEFAGFHEANLRRPKFANLNLVSWLLWVPGEGK